ncbi:MAG: nicotinate-nucleotide--dimethylbenzimidazole phosphoribosyltransferase [Dehalococcoidia bacterium]
MDALERVIRSIQAPDGAVEAAARARQSTLTKPPNSLGRMEDLSVWLAGITGVPRPSVGRPTLILAAADHGVTHRGVSAYPAEVTGQMVRNFAAGGAAVNVLARRTGAAVLIVDAGVATPLDDVPGIIRRSHGFGTADLSIGPAMSRETAAHCLETGIEIAERAIADGADIIAVGEMGIGNTTPAAIITAVYTGLLAEAVTGRGTGVSDERFAAKVAIVRDALAFHRPDPTDPIGVLAAVGGFEIGVLAGAMLAAAAARRPVIVDGFITTAAALIANGLTSDLRPYLLAAHRSAEAGHTAALDHLALAPLLDLGMRLGEGTGALLAVSILDAAARLLDEMATFDEAGVAGADDAAAGPD